MPESEAHVYGDKTFTQMMYAKVVTVQLINRMGYDVLFQGEPRLSSPCFPSFVPSYRSQKLLVRKNCSQTNNL